jgi:hypothetical protein
MASQDLPVPELSRNMRLIGHTDQGGRPDGMQLMVHRGYGYVGHMFSKGFSVIDVKDPTRPKAVRYVPAPPNTWNIHLQAHNDLLLVINAKDMFAAVEFQDERAYYTGELGRKLGTAEGTGATRDCVPELLSTTFRLATNRARSASCQLMAAASIASGTRVDSGPTRQRSLTDSAITSSSPSICQIQPSRERLAATGCPV